MIKNKKTLDSTMKTTIVFGYSLFALMVLSYLVTIAIPFSLQLQVPTVRHFNVIVMILVFGIAAILPALVSYIIGDKATPTKNKVLHHYNGVLFAIGAFWAAMSFSWIQFTSFQGLSDQPYPVPMIITNITPVILTILLMAIIAVNYARQQKNTSSVLQYRPFQIIVIALVLISHAYPNLSGFAAVNAAAILGSVSAPIIATTLAYVILARYGQTPLARLSDAIVAMSIGWVATLLTSSFTAFLRLDYQSEVTLGYVVGIVVFGAYLYLRTREP